MARFLRSNRRNSGKFLIVARAFRSSDSNVFIFIFIPLVLCLRFAFLFIRDAAS